MQALICEAFGPVENLLLAEVAAPVPAPGQVLIDVHACGVNFPDSLIVQGRYQYRPPLPFSPGCEVSGVVREVAADVDAVRAGDRVLAWLGWGGFAEQAVAPAASVFAIPAKMDWPAAAAFILTYGTAYHALVQRAALQPGETLAVLGAGGGVGLAAVELGRALGARVIACAGSEEKRELARARGADTTIDYSGGDLKQALKAQGGADVILDPVGGALAEPALRAINWEGRYLVVGFAAGDIPRLPLNLALLKGCQIVGVFWGRFVERDPVRHRENLQALLALFEAGAIAPHVSRTFSLAEAARAIAALGARQALGKLVVVVRP